MPRTEAEVTAANQTVRDFVRDNTPDDVDDPVRAAFLILEEHVFDWQNAREVAVRQARAQDPLRRCLQAAERLANAPEGARDLRRAELRTRIQEVKDADRGA